MAKKMNAILMLAMLVIGLSFSENVSASTGRISIIVSDGNAKVGGEVTISVVLNPGSNPIGSGQFSIEHSNALQYVNHDFENHIGAVNPNNPGRIQVSFASIQPIASEASIVHITFRISPNANGELFLTFADVSLFDSTGNAAALSVTNATINSGAVSEARRNIITFSGFLSERGQTVEHRFTAPKSGIFNFEFLADGSGDYRFTLTDSRSQRLVSSWLSNGGASQYLHAGQEYIIVLENQRGTIFYEVNTHVPFETAVIGNQISGSLDRIGQVNKYTFVAARSGYHQFDFWSSFNGEFAFELKCHRGQRINRTWLSNGGFAQYLIAGQQTRFYITQSRGLMGYNIQIHPPHESIVIGNRINGSLSRVQQVNTYLFTPMTTGTFTFNMTGDFPRSSYSFEIYNESRRITRSWVEGSQSTNVQLEAGRTYRIQVRQNRHFLCYNIDIVAP